MTDPTQPISSSTSGLSQSQLDRLDQILSQLNNAVANLPQEIQHKLAPIIEKLKQIQNDPSMATNGSFLSNFAKQGTQLSDLIDKLQDKISAFKNTGFPPDALLNLQNAANNITTNFDQTNPDGNSLTTAIQNFKAQANDPSGSDLSNVFQSYGNGGAELTQLITNLQSAAHQLTAAVHQLKK